MGKDIGLKNKKNNPDRTLNEIRYLLVTLLCSVCMSNALAEKLADVYYSTVEGDNLRQISDQFLHDPDRWRAIARANRIKEPFVILPGQRIRIPADELRRVKSLLLLAAHGEVTVCDQQNSCSARLAGQTVLKGEVIQTGENSSALLTTNGHRISLLPNSALTLKKMTASQKQKASVTELSLPMGEVSIEANIPKKRNDLRVLTPTAQAMVRGTRFRLAYRGDVAREETIEGKVEVSAGRRDRILVASSKGVIVRRGESFSAQILPPAPMLDDMPQRFEKLPIQFKLPSSQDLQSWVATVSLDAAQEQILEQKTVSAQTPAVSFADFPDGKYYFHLRGVATSGLNGLDAVHEFEIDARPFPPILNRPGNQAKVRDEKQRLQWTPLVGEPHYRLRLSDQEDFGHTLFDAEFTETLADLPFDLVPEKSYWWQVASIDDSGQQGPWSEKFVFTYSPRPEPPDPGQIGVGVENKELVINVPPAPGLGYHVKLSRSKDMADPVEDVIAEDEHIRLLRPPAGQYFLAISRVDRSDGTEGPATVSSVDLPSKVSPWLLLIPVVLIAL